jgi:hypothetical protein
MPPLTIDGLPLSRVLQRTALGDPLPVAGLLRQETGQISGIALDGEGQPLADHSVRLTRIVMVGDSRGEQVSGTDTTDPEGRFEFTGLRASECLLEVFVGDEIVANTSVTLGQGAMRVSGLTLAGLADEPGMSRGAKIAIGFLVAVACGVGSDADPCRSK